jgi:hypothetical protein
MRPNAISYSANLADLQDVGIERTSSRQFHRSAFGRRHNLEESGRGLIEPSLNFFMQKRQEWATFFSKKRSIDDFIAFNRKLAGFTAGLSQNKEALDIEEKLLKLISKIQVGIFLWREQYRHVRQLTTIYGMVRAFVSAPEFMFIDVSEVRARLFPFGRFEPFFRTPYYSDDSQHFFAVAIYEFFTNLFWAFLRLYVSFPTGTYSRVDDEMFSLIDPFTREKIRTDNRRMYRAEVEEVEGFELVKLINTLVERFLISEAIRWGKDFDSNMVVPILTLINEALSIGLIRAQDCQQLLLNLQLLTEALAFIEQTISNASIEKGKLAVLYIQEENEESSRDGGTSRAEAVHSSDNHEELQQCKLLISKIVLQVIFVYSDHAFVTACRRNISNRVYVDRKDVLRDRLQTNKTLYKSICLILLRYLLSKHDLKSDPKIESALEVNQCLLLIFLTDAKRNYFLESIDLVHDQFSERYLADPNPALAQRVNEVLGLRNELLELIRRPGKRQTRAQLLDKLSDICAAIPEIGPSSSYRATTEPDPTELTSSRSKGDLSDVDVPFTLELAWKGVTRFVLLLTEKLSFSNDEKMHLNHLFELLRRLLKNNHVAQSLLFRGGTCAAYTQIFIEHRFRTMRLLIEVFEHDFALLNQSYQVFDIKMLFYKDLLEQYERTKNQLETDHSDHPTLQQTSHSKDNQKAREFRASISALLLFNIFLDKVMKMNIKSTTEKWRKYDLVLQLKIFKIVANEALPAILNPDFLTKEEQKHVDLERLGRFRFTKEKAVELRSIIDAVPLNVARYYVYFSFVKMFVTATTFVYSKVVYDEIFEALKGLKGQHLPRSFASAIMVRTQIVKLIDRFWIFPNNHLLYEGLKDGEYIDFKRRTIPVNFMQMHQFLEYEMIWFEKLDIQADDPNDPRVIMLKDYVYWALLPALFKLAQAILSSISIIETTGTINNLWYFCNRLVSLLDYKDRADKILQVLGKQPPEALAGSNRQLPDLLLLSRKRTNRGLLLTEEDPLIKQKTTSIADLPDFEKLMTDPISPGINLKSRKRGSSFGSQRELKEKEKEKEMDKKRRQKSLVVSKGLAGRSRSSLYSVMDHLVTSGYTSNRIGNEVFEERLNPELKKCRRAAQRVLEIVEGFYQLRPSDVDPLSSYRHTDRTWMFAHIKPGKVAKTSKTKQDQLDGILEVARDNKHSVIWIVKQIYMTKEIKPQSDKNPLIKLLTIDSHYSVYNYNVARSCISMLANMTPGDNEDNYYRCFFIKQIYADEIKAVNYLMNYSGDLRIQMYNILRETTGPGELKKSHHINYEGLTISGAFLRGLWSIYVNLTLFIYYKTFDDKYLKYHWGLNLLISDFIRNFFMNNFSKFKTFLSENGFGVTRPGSDKFAIERENAVLTVIKDEGPQDQFEPIPDESVNVSDMKDVSSMSKSLSNLDKEEGLGEKLAPFKRAQTKNIDEESEDKGKGKIRIDSEVPKGGLSPFPVVDRRLKEASSGIRTPRSSKSRDSKESRSLKSSKFRNPAMYPIPGFAPPSREDGNKTSSDNTPDANPESIFIENFALMAQLFDNCSIARDMETCIVPSDKANLFSVLVQVMGNLTEFVTGPCLINQLRIYDHQTYIWIGILNRYIEDVDSDFYHVKLAVLEYLMGLIQGLNHRIIDFLSQQLQVHTLYEVTMLLSRLLYLRFATEAPVSLTAEGDQGLNDKVRMRKERQRRFRNYKKTDHFVSIDNEIRTKHTITSPDEMMELYKRNTDFNTHLIMQIVMHSYVFMRSVGDKIKFWQLYLKEKEAQAHKWEESNHERENNIVFKFVLKMMFSIEIVHEMNREDNEKDDDEENEKMAMADRIVTIQEAHNQSSDSLHKRLARIRPVGSSVQDHSRSRAGWSRTHNSRIQASLRRSSQAPDSLKLLALNNVQEINPFFDNGGPKKRIQRRFYFQTPPLTLFWTKAMKNRVMDNIPTSTTNRKQVYFYSQIKQLTLEAELHSERVRRFGYAAYLVTPDAFAFYEIFLFLFSLAQNIILMIYLQSRPTAAAFVSEWDQINDLQIGWALSLTALSFVVLVLWIIARWRIYCVLNQKEAIAKKRRQLTRAEKIKVYLLDSLIFNPTFSSFFLNFLITILGLTVYTGIYTLNLFLAVKIFRPMSDILRAILQSGRQLVSTFQLMTLLIYFYSWVTILGLTDRIIDNYGGPRNCRSIYECLFNTWNFGLRESGGLGAALNTLQEPKFARFWLNWVVSISYLIIVKFIVLNIVAGIIIEGFGELREERSKREFVVKNFCPICGMNRWDSERVGVPFEDHIGRVHNVWNYLKFLVHLNQVNESNLVGFEFDISNQLHYNQTRWFPKNKILQEDQGYEELDGTKADEESEEEDDD